MLKIVRNDITKMQVDAIVNTANEAPTYFTGVDSAIYKAAGEEQLLAARRKIGYMVQGEVAVTPGFNLPAKYIIHAVSPCYIDGESGEELLLRDCYRNSLELACKKQCQSIAFPLISTGGFGYPKEDGMRIAVDEIHAFLLHHDMLVYLVVFDGRSTELGKKLYPDLEVYIDNHYVQDKLVQEYDEAESSVFPCDFGITTGFSPMESNARGFFPSMKKALSNHSRREEALEENILQEEEFCQAADNVSYDELIEETERALKERMLHMSDTFQECLLYQIKRKGLTNAEVYKRAIITKQLFSKIKLNPDYHPDKATAMRLCIGAKLNPDEAKDLLARAGYALSPCDKRDIIFSYFIEKGIFDMIEIDIVLEQYDLPSFIA